MTEIVANVTKNVFQSMGLAWLDTLKSEEEDEDEQEEQLEGDAIGSPRESICSDTFTLVSDKAARQRAQAAAAGQAPSVALEAEAASATETAKAKLAVAKFRMQRAAMLGKGTPSCSNKIATQGVMLATEPAKEEEAPVEGPAAVGGEAPSVAPEAEAAPATEKKTAKIAKIDGATFKMQLAANTALFRNGTLPRRAKPAEQAVMAATEPAKEEEAPAEAPAAVGCQAPSVAPEAEAAPATEKKTVEIANIDGATFKMQLAASTALLRNGTLPRRAKSAKQAVMAATKPAKEEEALAEVASPAVNSEVVQQFVAALLSLVQHCKFAKKP